jgi:hypothetical protein
VLLLTVVWSVVSYVSEHIVVASAGPGLIGAPVDPRYGQSDGDTSLLDYFAFGYDCARDISRTITLLTFILVFWWPLAKGTNLRRVIWELVNLSCIPLLVHLVGTFLINNFGGIGGGL